MADFDDLSPDERQALARDAAKLRIHEGYKASAKEAVCELFGLDPDVPDELKAFRADIAGLRASRAWWNAWRDKAANAALLAVIGAVVTYVVTHFRP